jgi:hypothetical protein
VAAADVDIAKALSVALAPVFLITGVASLLASMNTRFGRVIDRSRHVLREARQGLVAAKDVDAELKVLYRRARRLRATIILASVSIFAVALCIFLIFTSVVLGLTLPYVIPVIFTVGLLFLIASLVLFIQDFAVSLTALKHEMLVATGRQVVD